MSRTTCPVFRPTKEEFEDFSAYLESIDEEGREYGLIKVIPPEEFRERRLCNVDEIVNFVIPAPLRQCVSGGAGVFTVNILDAPPMTMYDFRDYAKKHSEPDNTDKLGDEKRARIFWKGLSNTMKPPLYGADLPGTLFMNDPSSWNVARLDTILQVMGEVPGVTTPMLYVGMWRSMFAFHVEDVDLYSINYIHCGAGKSWYTVPPRDRQRMESMAQGCFPADFQACPEHLRHKTSLFSPMRLHSAGIKFYECVQNAGEFMITYPGAYHGGFNHDFNIAESSNFALDRWIPIGKVSKFCRCRPHSVRMDVNVLEHLVHRARKQFKDRNARISWLAYSLPGSLTEEDRELLRRKRPRVVLSMAQVGCSGSGSGYSNNGLRAGMVDRMHLQSDFNGLDSASDTEDEDSRWVFSCECGERAIKKGPRAQLPLGMAYECVNCGIWSHGECVFQSADPAAVPDGAMCRLCQMAFDIFYEHSQRQTLPALQLADEGGQGAAAGAGPEGAAALDPAAAAAAARADRGAAGADDALKQSSAVGDPGSNGSGGWVEPAPEAAVPYKEGQEIWVATGPSVVCRATIEGIDEGSVRLRYRSAKDRRIQDEWVLFGNPRLLTHEEALRRCGGALKDEPPLATGEERAKKRAKEAKTAASSDGDLTGKAKARAKARKPAGERANRKIIDLMDSDAPDTSDSEFEMGFRSSGSDGDSSGSDGDGKRAYRGKAGSPVQRRRPTARAAAVAGTAAAARAAASGSSTDDAGAKYVVAVPRQPKPPKAAPKPKPLPQPLTAEERVADRLKRQCNGEWEVPEATKCWAKVLRPLWMPSDAGAAALSPAANARNVSDCSVGESPPISPVAKDRAVMAEPRSAGEAEAEDEAAKMEKSNMPSGNGANKEAAVAAAVPAEGAPAGVVRGASKSEEDLGGGPAREQLGAANGRAAPLVSLKRKRGCEPVEWSEKRTSRLLLQAMGESGDQRVRNLLANALRLLAVAHAQPVNDTIGCICRAVSAMMDSAAAAGRIKRYEEADDVAEPEEEPREEASAAESEDAEACEAEMTEAEGEGQAEADEAQASVPAGAHADESGWLHEGGAAGQQHVPSECPQEEMQQAALTPPPQVAAQQPAPQSQPHQVETQPPALIPVSSAATSDWDVKLAMAAWSQDAVAKAGAAGPKEKAAVPEGDSEAAVTMEEVASGSAGDGGSNPPEQPAKSAKFVRTEKCATRLTTGARAPVTYREVWSEPEVWSTPRHQPQQYQQYQQQYQQQAAAQSFQVTRPVGTQTAQPVSPFETGGPSDHYAPMGNLPWQEQQQQQQQQAFYYYAALQVHWQQQQQQQQQQGPPGWPQYVYYAMPVGALPQSSGAASPHYSAAFAMHGEPGAHNQRHVPAYGYNQSAWYPQEQLQQQLQQQQQFQQAQVPQLGAAALPAEVTVRGKEAAAAVAETRRIVLATRKPPIQALRSFSPTCAPAVHGQLIHAAQIATGNASDPKARAKAAAATRARSKMMALANAASHAFYGGRMQGGANDEGAQQERIAAEKEYALALLERSDSESGNGTSSEKNVSRNAGRWARSQYKKLLLVLSKQESAAAAWQWD